MEKTFHVKSIEELDKVANFLLSNFDTKLFLFKGNLGSGKTTLIKFLTKKLNAIDKAISPTFSILNVYKTIDNNELYHFDLYRIEKIDELIEIGFEDYILAGKYCFIEWAEKVEDFLENYVSITITPQKDNSRIIKIEKK